jgi:hypothetical protein
MVYTIVRSLRGSWPEWYVTTDDGTTVYVRIRHGEGWVGAGKSEEDASETATLRVEGPFYQGVTDVVDALRLLKMAGYHYVCPTGVPNIGGNVGTIRPMTVDVDWPRQAGFSGAKFRGKVLEAVYHHTLGSLFSVQALSPIPGLAFTRLWVEARYCKEVKQ